MEGQISLIPGYDYEPPEVKPGRHIISILRVDVYG